jgi:hypothetical protein
MVARAIEGLYDHLNRLSEDETLTIGKDFAKKLKADLRTRSPFWQSVTAIPEIYLVAALLDPCNKNLDFLSSTRAKERAFEAFKTYYDQFFGDIEDGEDLVQEFSYDDGGAGGAGGGVGDYDARHEVSRYLAHPQLRDDGKENEEIIQKRWRKHVRGQFPNIYKLACIFWAAPASSAPCERLFSKASIVWDVLRNLIDTENASSQLFLHYFISIMHSNKSTSFFNPDFRSDYCRISEVQSVER